MPESPLLTRFNVLPNGSDEGEFPFMRSYLFGNSVPTPYEDIDSARAHLMEAFRGNGDHQRFGYLISFMWGEANGGKMIDWFGYIGTPRDDNWQTNPGVTMWVTRNGMLEPRRGLTEAVEDTCETSLIVLGKEGEHRRAQTGDNKMEQYMLTPPNLGIYEPETTIRL